MIRAILAYIFVAILVSLLGMASVIAEEPTLLQELESQSSRHSGRLGVCALLSQDTTPVCIRGEESFPLQSVMKLIVGVVVLDQVDRGMLRITDVIQVKPEDASPGPQQFSDLVRRQGSYDATIEELIRHAIIDSDSTSADLLIAHVGGISAVQAYLKRAQFSGIRVDRNERQLQSEALGLSWRSDYADPRKFEAALRALSRDQRNKAWKAHLKDPRDRATPRAMVSFLQQLLQGKLLSPPSTTKLIQIMEATATGKDRLWAGVPSGWKVAHKTGTGPSWGGLTETANDSGFLIAPDGSTSIVSVFLAESTAVPEEQALAIAEVARSVVRAINKRGARYSDDS